MMTPSEIRFLTVFAVALAGIASHATAAEPALPEVFKADFESADLDNWTLTDADAFRIGEDSGQKVLELHKRAKYSPKVRSPYGIAILEEPILGSFDLQVRVRSTVKDYGHRDLCVIFGYQDPEHFYYVHLGKKADAHANSIFLVDGSPRVSIATERTKGTDWDDNWHKVRVTRNADSGEILIYFDDMEKPVMKTVDKTFLWGKVGLGSFDDTGMFDDLVIDGEIAEAAE